MGFIESPVAWFVTFALGATVILLAGARLPRLGRTIALRLGVGETSVGLFGLAIVTSLPELAVTLSAMRLGAPDLALGNVLGSNNFNLATAGLLSLACGGGLFLRADLSRYRRTGVLLILSTALAGLGVLAGPSMPEGISLLAFSVPIVLLFVVECRMGGSDIPEPADATVRPREPRDYGGVVVAFLALSALVVAAGVAVSWAAKQIAVPEFTTSGGTLVLGETFVGTLLVAIATSLPEVTVAFSAMRGADSADMALGTLLGSNSFNLLVFALGAPMIAVGPTGGVSAWSNLAGVNLVNVAAGLLLTSMILLALRAARSRARNRALDYLMMAVYVGAVFAVFRL